MPDINTLNTITVGGLVALALFMLVPLANAISKRHAETLAEQTAAIAKNTQALETMNHLTSSTVDVNRNMVTVVEANGKAVSALAENVVNVDMSTRKLIDQHGILYKKTEEIGTTTINIAEAVKGTTALTLAAVNNLKMSINEDMLSVKSKLDTINTAINDISNFHNTYEGIKTE